MVVLSLIYPVKLKAACKDYIWGGTRLRTEYHQQSSADKIAESWMLSAHPDGPSTIVNGECAGMLLPDYFAKAGHSVFGTDCAEFPDFPVLIKLIDAKDKLSVQVHPDDAYARAHGEPFGKTEMWYIIANEPGASLYYGFDHKITKDEFKKRIKENTVEEVLNKVPVHPGDVFFIESRTLHAIGAGILLAEIQQSSNLTYRIYDYGRLGKDGKPRQLHIPQALDVTRLDHPTRPTHPQGSREKLGGCSRILLASCDIFTVYEMEINEYQLDANEKSFNSLICIGGEAKLLKGGKEELSFCKGDSIFIPAGYGKYTVKGNCHVLMTTV